MATMGSTSNAAMETSLTVIGRRCMSAMPGPKKRRGESDMVLNGIVESQRTRHVSRGPVTAGQMLIDPTPL
ncbi:hypothetical protein GCM10027292_28970 [Hydrogenophaga aquatica]